MIKENDFLAWKDDPVTKTVFDWLELRREAKKEDWAQGGNTRPTIEETVIQNLSSVAYCNALDELIELDYETLKGEMEDVS